MREHSDTRDHAVERLRAARDRLATSSGDYDAARGSPGELSAFTELQAAENLFAAREAWLAWIDRDY